MYHKALIIWIPKLIIIIFQYFNETVRLRDRSWTTSIQNKPQELS